MNQYSFGELFRFSSHLWFTIGPSHAQSVLFLLEFVKFVAWMNPFYVYKLWIIGSCCVRMFIIHILYNTFSDIDIIFAIPNDVFKYIRSYWLLFIYIHIVYIWRKWMLQSCNVYFPNIEIHSFFYLCMCVFSVIVHDVSSGFSL